MGVLGGLILKPSGGEVPIMSFQTNRNGTFNPSMTIASGTLRWVIGGEEFISNSPSKVLTGSTVNVKVFANTVSLGAEVTDVQFGNIGMIGDFSFAHFLINGNFRLEGNITVESLTFSEFENVITQLRAENNDLSAADLSNVRLNGGLRLQDNNNLASFIPSTEANICSIIVLVSTSLPFIDMSNYKLTALANFSSNPLLTTIIQGGGFGSSLSDYLCEDCALSVTSVNNIFSALNTAMSAVAPTNDLTCDVSGGTSASPTGGSSNTDLVNLRDVVYPNAGFTFTALIN